MKAKTTVKELRRQIALKKRELEKTTYKEAKSRKRWTAEYGRYMQAGEDLADLKMHGTAKEKTLKEKVKGWRKRSRALTDERNTFREAMRKSQEELNKLGLELARVTEQANNETDATDEIVTQVFSLNGVVVRAATDREDCLKRHVFPRLLDPDGQLCSQVSFTSSDGLRRVVAMVNTMTIVRGDLASQAQSEIERFFARFSATAMDKTTAALYKLTKEILVEKTNFKVGPDLYRFLGMELDEELFPELSLAQRLLRRSIRSEKTNSYIRLYERSSTSSKWEVVKQS